MAKLEKSRARKPLAEGQMSLSWGQFGLDPNNQHYGIGVTNDDHRFTLKLTPKESLSFISWFAGRETFDPVPSWAQDKRGVVERLRALADKLEAEEDRRFIDVLDGKG